MTRINLEKIFRSLSLSCLLIALLAGFTAGCQVSSGFQIPGFGATQTPDNTVTPVQSGQSEATSAQPTEEQVLSTPTPAPTATPGQLDFLVNDISRNVGIDEYTIFGLNGEDLVNLLISAAIFVVGALLGVVVVNSLLWVFKRTPTKFDDRLLGSVDTQLKWLIGLIFLQYATVRLAFFPPGIKQGLNLIYFTLFVLVIVGIGWKLIDFGLGNLIGRVSSPQNRNLLVTFSPLLIRSLQILILFIGLAIILQNFGVNLSALLAVLGLGGLAVSLAAKETLEDIINGFIILIDRPFHIGDRIKIETMDTWGNVEAIGARTTQIRTLDNRLIIVPNSIVGNSQVENYTATDTKYRIDITLGIAYGSDIDQVIETIENALIGIEGILEDPSPIVALNEFGNSAMIFNVFYWLRSFENFQVNKTTVNKTIYQALNAAKIEMPFTTYDINLAYKEPQKLKSMNNDLNS